MTMSPDHPDFEDLSAFHDGEAPEWADHLAGCGSCRSTLAELVTLSEAVARVSLPARPAGPATEPGDDHSDAVARALFSAQGAARAQDSAQGAARAQDSAQGAARAQDSDGGLESTTGSGTGKRHRRQWVLGVSTAAVLVLSIAIGVTVASKGPHQEMTRDALSADGTRTTAKPAEGTGPGTVMAGGDLGEIPDRAALVARVGADLRAKSQARAAQGAPPAPAAAPVPTAPRPCETEARADPGDRGELIYQASAVEAGAPAVVLAFGSGQGSPTITVEARARSDCRLLLQGAIP